MSTLLERDRDSNIFRRQPGILRDDRTCRVSGDVKVPDRSRRDARAGNDRRIVNDISILDDPANLRTRALFESICRQPHVVRNRFEADRENFLTGAARFYGFVTLRIEEHHSATVEGKAQTGPRFFVPFLEPSTDSTKFLQRDLVLVSKDRDRPEPDDIPERVDATERPALEIVKKRGGEEVGGIPVPDLPGRESGEPAYVIRRKRSYFSQLGCAVACAVSR